MQTLLWMWIFGGLASLLGYAVVSYRYDRRFVTSTWINLWLGLMVILGPLGTLLTARTLGRIVGDVRRERALLQATGSLLPNARSGQSASGHPPCPRTTDSLAGVRP